MTYDRPIIISAGKSRKDINWQRQTLTVSELYDRLKTPARGVEALSEYTKMKKAQQDEKANNSMQNVLLLFCSILC